MHTAKTRRYAWAIAGLATAGLLTAACSSSSSTPSNSGNAGSTPAASSPSAAAGGSSSQAELKTEKTKLGTVLANSQGFTVYWFAADTATKSNCTGACATYWPPVTGTPMAASGVTLSGKLGTITRSGGVTQVTYNGHPLYTFKADTAPGQVNGNGVDGFGAKWYAIKTGASGAAPASSPSHSGGGYGY
ncbi:MAG: hypothetical protein JOY82_04970 [Streptosporangiaceae bacterium]|nr:hypothetical protein [Streptosporangiaceae bacterium]MBV9853860.1 hypothetical protein [Streptosporangiaceae bacterium]